MRAHDPPQIFKNATCSAGCRTSWTKCCSHCNLVFCANHIIPSEHKCGQHQQDRIFPELVEKPKKPRKKASKKKGGSVMDKGGRGEKPTTPRPTPPKGEGGVQPTLHQGPPTANGTASATPESGDPQR